MLPWKSEINHTMAATGSRPHPLLLQLLYHLSSWLNPLSLVLICWLPHPKTWHTSTPHVSGSAAQASILPKKNKTDLCVSHGRDILNNSCTSSGTVTFRLKEPRGPYKEIWTPLCERIWACVCVYISELNVWPISIRFRMVNEDDFQLTCSVSSGTRALRDTLTLNRAQGHWHHKPMNS